MLFRSLVHNVCTQGRGSIGRTEPRNLMEEMAYEAAKKHPFEEHSGKELLKLADKIGDKRWKGWQKWQAVFKSNNGKVVNIHFVYDPVRKLFDDFKFKN